jgi:hypothetical protein
LVERKLPKLEVAGSTPVVRLAPHVTHVTSGRARFGDHHGMAVETHTANLFELRGRDTRITYSTGSLAGAPQLAYNGPHGRRVFSGDDIESRETALGTEVTVTVEEVPDLQVVTLTLVLPEVRAEDGGVKPLETVAICTTTVMPLAGRPPAVAQTYRVSALRGAARLVDF